MTLLKIDSTLTGKDDPSRKQQLRTHAGQAYFAGTGPYGQTCQRCSAWQGSGHKHNPCAQYQKLMRGMIGPKVPADAAACKYFEARKEAAQ